MRELMTGQEGPGGIAAEGDRPRILAVVYRDGPGFDSVMFGVAADLKRRGLRLAGVAQSNPQRVDRTRCDMVLEELSTGMQVLISEDRGALARGCRLDLDAMADVIRRVEHSLAGHIDAFLLNKFGKEEAEGRGLRGALALAAERGVPAVVGVPRRNLDSFRNFLGGVAEEAEPDAARIFHWLALALRTGPERTLLQSAGPPG